MKCFVIAHPAAKTLNDCVNSLRRYNWNYEIFSAVDGWQLSTTDWDRIGVKISGGKISQRPGAQGCWHSHFHLWHKSIEINQEIIILECDTVVTDRLPEIDCSAGLVKLYQNAVCKTHPIFGQWSKGSHGYMISPDQAKSLISFSRLHGAQALDKHLGDKVIPWRFYHENLVVLNPRRGISTTSSRNRLW
jgi:GR25 family glycosyltransferase involved in LPS biosynthesis